MEKAGRVQAMIVNFLAKMGIEEETIKEETKTTERDEFSI